MAYIGTREKTQDKKLGTSSLGELETHMTKSDAPPVKEKRPQSK